MIDIYHVFGGNRFHQDESITEILIYYDGPMLFTIKRDEATYLVAWASDYDENNVTHWMICPYNSVYTWGQSLLPFFEEAKLNDNLGYFSVSNDLEIKSLTFDGELNDYLG